MTKSSSRSSSGSDAPRSTASGDVGYYSVDWGEWEFAFDSPDDQWLHDVARAERPEELLRIRDYELIESEEPVRPGDRAHARLLGPNVEVMLWCLSRATGERPGDESAALRRLDALAAVSHPSIPAPVAWERVGDRLLLATEWVAGEAIDARLGRLEGEPRALLHRALELLVRVAGVVRFAHTCGVLHGRLEASAVLLDEDDEPHLVGLGVPGYDEDFLASDAAAPELRRAAIEPDLAVDLRADVYALGVLAQRLVGEAPDRPAELDELVARATSGDPERRPSSVGELAETLEAVIAELADR